MGKLTGTQHGDAANELLGFYTDKACELEDSGQYSMAAIALALALETAVLTYLLVEFGEDNGGELQIPPSVNMSELIEAANEIDVLSAPIDIPSHIREDDRPPKYVAKDVVDKIRLFRNLIHPARALKESYKPANIQSRSICRIQGNVRVCDTQSGLLHLAPTTGDSVLAARTDLRHHCRTAASLDCEATA